MAVKALDIFMMVKCRILTRKTLIITIIVSTAGFFFIDIQRSPRQLSIAYDSLSKTKIRLLPIGENNNECLSDSTAIRIIKQFQESDTQRKRVTASASMSNISVRVISKDQTHKSPTSVSTRNTNQLQKSTNAVFLKVHKAGSTTVMNIFLRFGISNNPNIVLPVREYGGGFNYLGYGKTLYKKNIVPIPDNETYNIVCNHVIYKREAFQEIMPADTLYIGILREPVSHFVSASVYYGFIRTLKNNIKNGGQVRSELDSPGDLLHEFLSHLDEYSDLRTKYVRNRMSFDFGLPASQFNNKSFIEKFITDLEKDFKLIMILEYFSESLVLMKRYLHWDLKDILYVPLNVNERKRKKMSIVLHPTDKHILRQWNYADFRLYSYFKRRFLKQVKAEGPMFYEEADHFQTVLQSVQRYCLEFKYETDLVVNRSDWNQNFNISGVNCRAMMMNEVPMVRALIQKAKHKYQTWYEKLRAQQQEEDPSK